MEPLNQEQYNALKDVQQIITEESLRMHMDFFRYGVHNNMKIPSCGTICCIAGWLDIRNNLKERHYMIDILLDDVELIKARAAEFLGYQWWGTDMEELFYVARWPNEFRERLEETESGTPEYAAIVCERIDEYIAARGIQQGIVI